ncbi:tRNA (adenosine(37)-N6)-dimethylallyltransferase MiaA [Paludibacter sp. 221]|uniref:tRNA (adenosine(37)-N6)-dimethylallyltransferase MiaA n=1 Tax=Paludibacter sp. 221 TaxID=2302939 RepID=UPI0013D2EF15|nr:tRNA (adenosine(37)-N6)-dimethylallyltransferase MiaA [Paludibacter sp. 221]NDV46781.1 tRNA (adenosine(37)-N6)-dimethylallyltransferase MiaA [Paludibacter sp. 221]
MNKPTLLVLVGPTGVGKTDISVRLAKHFAAPIISSDSRQFYKELKIGTAAPTEKELEQVRHYFIGSHSIFDLYNSGQYELDVLKLLNELFSTMSTVMLVGGSMMYVDAVCKGIDDIPTVDEETRQFWLNEYKEKGAEFIISELKRLDPIHYELVDLQNHKRVLHALEICSIIGKPYSEIRTGQEKKRPFNIIKIGLIRPREELYERINLRVDKMMEDGLLEEARQFYEFRHLNTLNTVGYKELYEYMSGNITLEEAVELIKRDSRRYAKRQLSWFNNDKEIHWFHPGDEDEILNFVSKKIQDS